MLDADTALDALRARGLRITPQRRALVEVLADNTSHPSPDEIAVLLSERMPGISLSTVYATLHEFADAGLVRRLSTQGGMRFDPETAPHAHLLCIDCGSVVDVDVPHDIVESLAAAAGVDAVDTGVTLHSVCSGCSGKENLTANGDRVKGMESRTDASRTIERNIMVEKYRCSGCGYFHIGPAPERCPVCGAPQTAFKEYAGPGDLTGTKTLENLAAAFAGESQANRRYTLWKRIAELEGAPESTLKAFQRAADEETAHALGHLAYIAGATSTRENLMTAAAGEDGEATEMYPQFAAVAEDEGFPEIAAYFRAVGRFEAEHREDYRTALSELEGR